MQAGTRGLQGFKGDKGEPGNSFDPLIGNVDTLEPGQPATASTTIDEEGNLIYFNFGIPKGEKGDTGDTNLTTFDVENGKLIAYDEEGNMYNLGMVAMNPMGEYDNTVSYERLNTVLYNDSTYIALKSSLGNLPTNTEYWQLIGGGVTKEDTELVFNTVADMKTADLKEGYTVKTLGYYSANDGGGATYKIVETTSNYKEELSNGLYAELIIENKINVNQFGAYGDGIHDDYQVFVTMFSDSNKEIYLDNKTYLLSEKLYIKDKDNIIIHGNNATIKLETGTESETLTTEYGAINFDNCNNLIIDDLTIDTNANWYMRPHVDWGGALTPAWQEWLATRNKTYGGLALWSLTNANITNVKCMNSRTGFYINNCQKITLEECVSNRTFADGIYITNGSKYCYVNKHYCENTGDDCYSSDGWANGLNDYIYFTDCTAHISGGALLCANTTNHTFFTNLKGDELNYCPFKYEAFYADCENIVIENCIGITNNNMELEEEHGMPIGGRQSENWVVKNVEVRNSTIINKNPTSRRIEWTHQKIEGIKYINCYVENLTPLFYLNSKDIYIENCEFETQDAFSLIDVQNVELLNNKINNNSYFSNRGNANFYLLRTNNVTIKDNKLSVVADSSHDITFTGVNTYLTSDTEDISGSNTTLSNFKFLGMLKNSYWLASCVSGQLYIQHDEIQTITNNTYTGYLNTTITGNGLTCVLKRRGNYVTAYISGTNTNAIPNTGQYDLTIPNNFKPVADSQYITSTLGGKRYLLSAKTDGRLGVQWASETLPSGQTFFETISWQAV